MADNSFQLEIVTPDRLVVNEAANDVQIPGKSGYLGILPGHAPLITELAVGEMRSTARLLACASGLTETMRVSLKAPDRISSSTACPPHSLFASSGVKSTRSRSGEPSAKRNSPQERGTKSAKKISVESASSSVALRYTAGERSNWALASRITDQTT